VIPPAEPTAPASTPAPSSSTASAGEVEIPPTLDRWAESWRRDTNRQATRRPSTMLTAPRAAT
jgi:hypothetical protein